MGTDPCSTGGDGCGNTRGSDGRYYPTDQDAAAVGKQSCETDTTCSEKRPKLQSAPLQPKKSLLDPALGNKEVPLGMLRSNGYTGSNVTVQVT